MLARAAAGAAPVMDPCGVAGGHPPPNGAFGGLYVNTSHAKLGDFGSVVLPRADSGTKWKAGSTVEVAIGGKVIKCPSLLIRS